MLYKPVPSKRFTKDLKLMQKQQKDLSLLANVINTLSEGKQLDIKHRDHALQGDFSGYRECHVTPDWLLIYKIKDDLLLLVLYRTGSHSELY